MCNCKNKNKQAFDKALQQAESLSTRRNKYVVFFVTFPDDKGTHPFVKKEKEAIADPNICCYYLPNGTKVDKPK